MSPNWKFETFNPYVLQQQTSLGRWFNVCFGSYYIVWKKDNMTGKTAKDLLQMDLYGLLGIKDTATAKEVSDG